MVTRTKKTKKGKKTKKTTKGGKRKAADINIPINMVRFKDKKWGDVYIQADEDRNNNYYSTHPRISAKEVPVKNVKRREVKDINKPINLALVGSDAHGKIYIQTGDSPNPTVKKESPISPPNNKPQEDAAAFKAKQDAEALKAKQEAEALKAKQEAEALKAKQDAEALKAKQEAEALKVKQDAEALKAKQEAENKKKNEEVVKKLQDELAAAEKAKQEANAKELKTKVEAEKTLAAKQKLAEEQRLLKEEMEKNLKVANEEAEKLRKKKEAATAAEKTALEAKAKEEDEKQKALTLELAEKDKLIKQDKAKADKDAIEAEAAELKNKEEQEKAEAKIKELTAELAAALQNKSVSTSETQTDTASSDEISKQTSQSMKDSGAQIEKEPTLINLSAAEKAELTSIKSNFEKINSYIKNITVTKDRDLKLESVEVRTKPSPKELDAAAQINQKDIPPIKAFFADLSDIFKVETMETMKSIVNITALKNQRTQKDLMYLPEVIINRYFGLLVGRNTGIKNQTLNNEFKQKITYFKTAFKSKIIKDKRYIDKNVEQLLKTKTNKDTPYSKDKDYTKLADENELKLIFVYNLLDFYIRLISDIEARNVPAGGHLKRRRTRKNKKSHRSRKVLKIKSRKIRKL
jgi:hypothetical protein